MYDYKLIFGVAGPVVGIMSYIPYFRDMFRGRTKPHPFSWFVWGLMSAIVFPAQVVSNGGLGAWTTGITALACFSIAALAVFFGEHRVTKIDVVCFIGALIGIGIWKVTGSPLNAVVLVSAVYFIGFIPTFRKAYFFPGEETVATWELSLAKWGLGLLALNSYAFVDALFPAAVFLMNSSFLALLLIRRKQLRIPSRS